MWVGAAQREWRVESGSPAVVPNLCPYDVINAWLRAVDTLRAGPSTIALWRLHKALLAFDAFKMERSWTGVTADH